MSPIKFDHRTMRCKASVASKELRLPVTLESLLLPSKRVVHVLDKA